MPENLGRSARGAVYCRIPHRRAPDRAAVDEREHACRRLAADLGVSVSSRLVFLDARGTAWQQTRPGRAWDALLAVVRGGALSILLVYGIEELARHAPADAAELLEACGVHRLGLYDPCGERDWNDAAVRDALAHEVGRALRAARDAAATARRVQGGRVAAGLPHGGGRRAYGYTQGYSALVEAEAAVVREVFARFLAGESLSALAADLNRRGMATAAGGRWSSSRIARLLDAPRYAGLRVVRGQIARDADGNAVRGAWPACVSEPDWHQVRALRRETVQTRAVEQRPRHAYLLAGLVVCASCTRAMAGSPIGKYPTYACPTPGDAAPHDCARHIGARSLETLVQEHALRLLEQWDPDTALEMPLAMNTLVGTEPASRRAAGPHLLQPPEREAHARIIVRDAAALDGVTAGPDAREQWASLSRARRAAVVRFLFAEVLVGPKTTARSVFDEGRVQVVPGPLPYPAQDDAGSTR